MTKSRHIHLIGICGTAMASLAGMLQERGFRVTGSDAAAYPPMSTFLDSLGIPVAQPFAEANLDPRPDLVVVGNAPTALFRLLEIVEEGGARPAAVIGVPVGFIGAAESKVALAEHPSALEHVVVHGRRGGSAIAVAAVNALASEAE